MKTDNPIHNPKVISKHLGDEILLHSSEAEAVHILNPTARLIWDLCDGNHTAADITQEFLTTFSGIEAEQAHDDVLQTLVAFQEKGLIE